MPDNEALRTAVNAINRSFSEAVQNCLFRPITPQLEQQISEQIRLTLSHILGEPEIRVEAREDPSGSGRIVAEVDVPSHTNWLRYQMSTNSLSDVELQTPRISRLEEEFFLRTERSDERG